MNQQNPKWDGVWNPTSRKVSGTWGTRRSSRLMQIADFAAYAVYRWYEHEDGSYLSVMQGKFDHEGRRLHGLKCYPLESTKAYRG